MFSGDFVDGREMVWWRGDWIHGWVVGIASHGSGFLSSSARHARECSQRPFVTPNNCHYFNNNSFKAISFNLCMGVLIKYYVMLAKVMLFFLGKVIYFTICIVHRSILKV